MNAIENRAAQAGHPGTLDDQRHGTIADNIRTITRYRTPAEKTGTCTTYTDGTPELLVLDEETNESIPGR